MRKLVIIIASVVIFAAFAGCLGGGDEEKKEKPTELALKQGTIQEISGWIDDDGNEHASGTFPLPLNDSNIVSIEITVMVEDSNSENAETDQGSDPDSITVTAAGGNNTETMEGITPFSAKFEFTALGGEEPTNFLDGAWSVQIDAALGGGKPRFFFGFIIWIDQGVAYTISGQYTFLVEETPM
jgi:hypothetical protein